MAFDPDKLFVREFERLDGTVLKIDQSEIGDVGCVVWDAAIVLAAYLGTEDMRRKLSGKSVLELGAGTGIVGLQAACEGAQCEITDLRCIIPLIELNIEKNAHLLKGSAVAKPLDWVEFSAKSASTKVSSPLPDYIVLADCIYYPESIEALVGCIRSLAGENTEILCCHEERTTDNKPALQKKFFKLMSQYFNTERIPMEQQDNMWRSEDILIHRFTKL